MSTNGHGHPAPPILLTIAGFDPCCGAGTAADLKTFAAHGCYGVSAITSLTVQNTQGVQSVHNTPSAELRAQLEAIANDCDIAAVKIGMLGNRGNAVVVAEFLDAHKFAHVVHDPVMKSSSGTELLDAGGIKFVAAELLRRASVITPNIPEAEILTGLTIKEVTDMEAAARKIFEMGARAVIVKGGHMEHVGGALRMATLADHRTCFSMVPNWSCSQVRRPTKINFTEPDARLLPPLPHSWRPGEDCRRRLRSPRSM